MGVRYMGPGSTDLRWKIPSSGNCILFVSHTFFFSAVYFMDVFCCIFYGCFFFVKLDLFFSSNVSFRSFLSTRKRGRGMKRGRWERKETDLGSVACRSWRSELFWACLFLEEAVPD